MKEKPFTINPIIQPTPLTTNTRIIPGVLNPADYPSTMAPAGVALTALSFANPLFGGGENSSLGIPKSDRKSVV